MPTFSVITVCFNEAGHIKDTLDSIVSQSCNDYELIVVDGESTDGTKDVIKQYANHITWWCSERDKGIYNAMNKGVRHATGDYVIFMNGGDCFYDSTVLHDMVQTGLHADVIEALAVKKGTQELIRQHDPDLGRTLLTDCLCHQSTFIRRELLERFPYDETYKIASDWKFWLQTLLCHACTYQFVDRVVAAMDVNGITYSQLDLNKKERDAILAQFLPQGFAAPVISLIHEHHKMTHNILIQYVLFLEKHSMRSYHILRKMAKRMVNYVKWKKGSNQ